MYNLNKHLLTPQEYLSLSASEKAEIESTEIIPPKFSGNHFGMIEITYKYPQYPLTKSLYKSY